MKIQFTEEEKALYAIIEGPVWKDECEHGADSYVASFTAIMSGPRIAKFDLYVFVEHQSHKVCIRYGDYPEQYISPGSVLQFVKTTCSHEGRLPEYWQALVILEKTGQFTWNAKKEPTT